MTSVLWVKTKARKRKSWGSWSPYTEALTPRRGAVGRPVPDHFFWQTPGGLSQSSMQKTDALRGQQAHSDGSGGIPFIWQTARSCGPNVGLYVPDTTRHLPGLGHWWEHHPVHQSPSNHTETPSQVLPRKASVWTPPFYWACDAQEWAPSDWAPRAPAQSVYLYLDRAKHVLSHLPFIPWASENSL